MMRKKNGFSLIEIIVALGIASMLALVIHRMIQQTSRITSSINGLIDDYTDSAVGIAQIERDLTGIIGLAAQNKQESQKSKAVQDLKFEEKQPDATAEKEQSAKSEKPLPLCVIQSDNGSFKELRIMTTYAIPTIDIPAIECVLVRYTLVPQPGTQGLFQLMRSEIPVARAASGSGTAYPVMSMIESCEIKCFFSETDDAGAEHIKQTAQWDSLKPPHKDAASPKKENAQKSDQPVIQRLPLSIELRGSLRSRTDGSTVPFDVSVTIPAAQFMDVVAIYLAKQNAPKSKLGEQKQVVQ